MMKPTQPQLKTQKKQTKSFQAAQQPPTRASSGGQPPQQRQQTHQQYNRQQSNHQDTNLQEIKEDIQLDPMQEAMVSLIQEYLLRYNLIDTLDVLQKEIMSQSTHHDNICESEILRAFDGGDQETFFALWNKFLPLNIRLRDDYAKNLEFYIQIYFLIYDINLNTSKKLNGQMQKHTIAFFKKYLDTKGQELSKTNEFLQFYALPYVQKPQDHQSYRHLFTQQWLVEIKTKLVTFLQDLTSKDQQTVLEQMYQQYSNEEIEAPPQRSVMNMSQSNNQNYTVQLEINNQELLGVIQDYNLKYNQMQKKFKEFIDSSKGSMLQAQQNWHHKGKEILAVSYDLMKMIQNPSKNNDLEACRKKIDKYEKFIGMSEQEVIVQSRAFVQQATIFENELSISPIPTTQKDERQFEFDKKALNEQESNNWVQLDFIKLHHLFMSQIYPDTLCGVLQALRWRITKAKGDQQRREVLIQYAQYDIIGCNPKNTMLMQKLLADCPDQVKEYSLRLINAIASDYYGRSYLMDSFHLVKTLIDILKKERGDTLIRRNSLGALQKLSLRRKPQIIMIENDLIKWIIRALKTEKDTLSEYSYEYITALFMNLSMRQKGKNRCEDPKEGVLRVLNDLLQHENIQVQTFVNGTLYSLFSKQSLRDQARAMGMVDVLQRSMRHSDERFTKQIEYIIVQLNSNKPDEQQMDDDNDIDDIDDIDDNEDVDEEEETEDHLETLNDINGEELLGNYFALNPQDAQMQINLTKSIMMENQAKRDQKIQQSKRDNNMLFRPATPTMSASQLTRQTVTISNAPPDLKLKNNEKIQAYQNLHQNHPIEEHKMNYNQQKYMDEPMIQQAQYQQVGPNIIIHAPNKDDITDEEHKIAFENRPKIVRSPPKNQTQVPHQYLKRK